MSRSLITIIGFAFFLIGFVALFLSLVGINLVILSPLESLGSTASLVTKLLMIVIGFVLIYVSKTRS